MAKCPACHAKVTFPEGEERTVCPECGKRLRLPPPKTDAPEGEAEVWAPAPVIPVEPPPGPPPPEPRPPRSVPTTLIALTHFVFAPVPAVIGIVLLVMGEKQPDVPREVEKEMFQFMMGAIALIVLAVITAGAGAATWSREQSGYFLTLLLAVATGAAAGASFEFDHPTLAAMSWSLRLGVPYAVILIVLLVLAETRRDFWPRTR